MNHRLFWCLLNYAGDGDEQRTVQGQDGGPGAGGDHDVGWWM